MLTRLTCPDDSENKSFEEFILVLLEPEIELVNIPIDFRLIEIRCFRGFL